MVAPARVDTGLVSAVRAHAVFWFPTPTPALDPVSKGTQPVDTSHSTLPYRVVLESINVSIIYTYLLICQPIVCAFRSDLPLNSTCIKSELY